MNGKLLLRVKRTKIAFLVNEVRVQVERQVAVLAYLTGQCLISKGDNCSKATNMNFFLKRDLSAGGQKDLSSEDGDECVFTSSASFGRFTGTKYFSEWAGHWLGNGCCLSRKFR